MTNNKRKRGHTIPPLPVLTLDKEDNLETLFLKLKERIVALDAELKIQRKVHLQTFAVLGYDPDRIRELDRKIREENK